jgi:hypothetical protein
MSETLNPIRPSAEAIQMIGHQVRRLRNHAAGYDSEAVVAFGRLLKSVESAIDQAALQSLFTADVFDRLSGQLKPTPDAATTFTARKIEAFAGLCQDQRQLIESFRGPADEGQTDALDEDFAQLIDLLAKVERQSNKIAAKMTG